MNRVSALVSHLTMSADFTPAVPISVIRTDNAPAPLTTYSQAIQAGETVYVSGCLGMDPKTGQFVSEEINGQTEQALKNIQAILEAANARLSSVGKKVIIE